MFDDNAALNARNALSSGGGDLAALPDPYGLDFDGDNRPDILWRNQVSGKNLIWFMEGENSSQYRSEVSINTVDGSWDIKSLTDFNLDGHPDLLWRHAESGRNIIWLMGGEKGNEVQGQDSIKTIREGWDLRGAADFNGDNNPDFLWRHVETGQNVIWYMGGENSTEFRFQERLKTIKGGWDISGVADFNEDGHTDIFWRNKQSGKNVVWFMGGENSSEFAFQKTLKTIHPHWDIGGIADFNQDGSPDIFWRHPESGRNVVWNLQGPYNTEFKTQIEMPTVNGPWNPVLIGWGSPDGLQPKHYVALTSPDGNSVLQSGSSYNIQWEDNIDENVRIDLYKGSQLSRVITASTKSDGAYRWTAPSNLAGGDNYQFRISSVLDSTVSDASDRNLTVEPKPAITVGNLNGSNAPTAGSQVSFTWNDNIQGNVKIDLYRGNQKVTTVVNATASDGRYDWRIPDTLQSASDYRLKITSTDGTVSDFSNSSFTINPKPAITVASPNGGNTLILGSNVAVKWNDNITGNVKIELYNGNQKVQTIASSTPSDGNFNWKVPTNLTRSDYYRLKITALDGTTSDFSNTNFTITPQPVLTVGVPNGGNTLTAGNTVTLKWNDNINGDVNIELYKGSTRVQTITSVTPSDGSFNWRVPDNIAAGSNYRLRIYASGNAAISDFSDSYLTILPKPVITVGEINSNQSLEAGKVHSIRWNDNFSGNVKIELYKGGKYNETIVATTAADGRYDWLVPTTFKSGDDYTFKISSVSNANNASDRSNNTFAIAPKQDGFNIEFDYRYAGNWFDSAKKAVLEKAAGLWEALILDEFDNVASGTRTTILNPSTGSQISFNINKEVDDVIVFAGARNLPGTTLATAGSTKYGDTRHNGNDYEPWSGQITFDTSPTWYVNSNTSSSVNVPSGQSDLLSVAVHELGHILGITEFTPAFKALTRNGQFIGAASKALNNENAIPLEFNEESGTYSHIKEDFEIPGLGENSLDPTLTTGTRKLITLLDAAILDDIGYDIDYKPLKQVTVTSPNGGNNLQSGNSYTINWSDNFKENVKIELFKGGRYHSTIASSTVSDGRQGFTVPSSWASGNDYKLKISSVTDGRVFDFSDRTFSITPKSNITINWPNGGNSVNAGQSARLTWDDNIGSNVKIELYKGGRYKSTIATSTSSDGEYIWNIPQNLAASSDYQIKVSSLDGSSSDLSNSYFTIKPNLTITSPNGGNVFRAGENISFTWNDNFDERVTIELYKGNSRYRTITGFALSDGKAGWTLPSDIPSGNDYRLKITSNNGTVSDFSDRPFSIVPRSAITVLSPNGGNNLTAGQFVSLTWSDNISGNVRIGLYKGSQLKQIISTSTPSDGQFSWTLPNNLTAGTDYKIKVTALDGSANDYSNTSFSIKPKPVLTITSPNGGNQLVAGTRIPLTWSDNINGNVRIDLYKGGQFDRTITSATNSDGRYDWTIPTNLSSSGNYQLKIISADGTVSDYSNGYFTIKPKPVIQVSSPNSSNTTYRPGSSYNITWSDNIGENVKIELYKGGQRNYTIASSTASDGSYRWTVPTGLASGNDYKLRISSTADSSVYDESNSNFSILADLKKYWFYYNYNVADYTKADSYAGSVIAEAGKYVVEPNYDSNTKFYDFRTSSTEIGLNGKYYIYEVEDYNDTLFSEAGRVFVREYLDRQRDGLTRKFIPQNYAREIQPSGTNYLGSEIDYIDASRSSESRFGADYYEANSPQPSNHWKAEYYNNKTLSGNPVKVSSLKNGESIYSNGGVVDVSTDMPQFYADWGDAAPASGVVADGFSARYTKTHQLAAGLYHIKTTSDDGVRVAVDGKNVIDRWFEQAERSFSGYFYTDGGEHQITMEYFDATLRASAGISFKKVTEPVDRALSSQINVYSNWHAILYHVDPGTTPGANFYSGGFSNKRAIGAADLGNNIRSDGEKGINANWDQWPINVDNDRLPHDNYAIRAYTVANFEAGKKYVATVNADDGFQLLAKRHGTNTWTYITAKDVWQPGTYGATKQIEFTVPQSGNYDFVFHHHETHGLAYFDLSWKEKSTQVTGQVVQSTSYVNIRSGPNVSFDDIGDAFKGQTLIFDGKANGGGYQNPNGGTGSVWYRIQGKNQWVAAGYITGVDANKLPLINANGGTSSGSKSLLTQQGRDYFLARSNLYISGNIFAQSYYGSSLVGGRGYTEGNCTWYVNGRLLELGGNYDALRSMSGNANQWHTQLSNGSYIVKGAPKAGDIAQWTTGGDNHVAVVESVNGDGTITVSESHYRTNFDGGGAGTLHRIKTYAVSNPTRYIRVPGVNIGSSTTSQPTSPDNVGAVVQSTSFVNLRSGPSISHSDVGDALKGQSLTFDGRTNGGSYLNPSSGSGSIWYRVKDTGQWVAAGYITGVQENNLPYISTSSSSNGRINDAGLNLIKSFEGVRLNAYQDTGGVWTIGYGHTAGVYAGQQITQAKANEFLRQDIAHFESAVGRAVKVPLTSNQFAALVSFTYNVGAGALGGSDLLAKLNRGDYTGASNEFWKWRTDGKNIQPGLVRRRAAEKALFLS